jgi:hypothetical protein
MAIIYSYPPNSNILPTDILVCTSTVLVGGKPKNQTKSISIQNLTSYVNTSSTNNLDQVLSNGNYSLLFANVGQLGLFDTSENDYALLKISDSEFIFEDVNGIATSQSRRGITLLGDGVHYGSIYLPPYTTSHQYDLPDNTGIIALTTDIPSLTGYVPYVGAIGDINIGNNSIYTSGGAKLWDDGTVEGTSFQFTGTSSSYISASVSTSRAWALPDASGIIALTSNLSAYVPYIGATQAVDLGAFNLRVNNISVGKGAGTGTNNTAIGDLTLSSNTTGFVNTAIGSEALKNNTTGYVNTAIGYQALATNTTGYQNTAVGVASMPNNTVGYQNIAVGQNTLQQNTTGYQNTAVGFQSLNNNVTANGNTAVGYQALVANTTGTYNNAFGSQSMFSNTGGRYNSAYGEATLYSNTIGQYNTAIGLSALRNNISALNNTASGFQSLFNTTTGGENSAYGVGSLRNNTTGIQNVGLGVNSYLLNATDSNSIVIGYNTTGAGSNTVTIGNTSITTTRLRGTVQGGSFVKDGGTIAQYLMADGSVTTAPYKYNFSGSLTLTGTLTTTNLLTITIPANSLSDYLDLRSLMVQQSGTVLGGMQVRVWHNSVNDFNTATRIANYAFGAGGADLFAQMSRRFSIQSGLLFGFPAPGSNVAGEGSTANAALSIPFNPAAINYLFVSIQLNNATDTAILRNVNITT